MTQDAFLSMCSTYCLVVGEGKDISNMTQDAKLGHMLNVAVCTGQEEGEEIITMTQNANYDHMFKVLQRRVTEL